MPLKVKVFGTCSGLMTAVWWTLLSASAGLLLWVYLLYPALLWLGSLPRRPLPPPSAALPSVSLILSVCNEAAVLRRKPENCMSLDDPADRPLSDEQLRELSGKGIDIQSHGLTHRPLTDLDDAALRCAGGALP